MVDLDRKAPAWGLSRWGLGGLRFHPVDEEAFTLRGGAGHVLYRGRERSHRFTILDDSRFEYDIILKKEPMSNRLYLFIDGWELFDFFRQPDGSYAVYRKESIMRGPCHTGTGKICHIHRPLIIDNRGREVWGDLWIDRGVLSITIPEYWLAEAAYPVIVDPVIGCSSVGASYYIYFIYNEEYDEDLANLYDDGLSASEIAAYFEDWKTMPSATNDLVFNRYTATETMQGKYKVFFYSAKMDVSSYNTFAPVGLYPVRKTPLSDPT
jgi:hypothetical protein